MPQWLRSLVFFVAIAGISIPLAIIVHECGHIIASYLVGIPFTGLDLFCIDDACKPVAGIPWLRWGGGIFPLYGATRMSASINSLAHDGYSPWLLGCTALGGHGFIVLCTISILLTAKIKAPRNGEIVLPALLTFALISIAADGIGITDDLMNALVAFDPKIDLLLAEDTPRDILSKHFAELDMLFVAVQGVHFALTFYLIQKIIFAIVHREIKSYLLVESYNPT